MTNSPNFGSGYVSSNHFLKALFNRGKGCPLLTSFNKMLLISLFRSGKLFEILAARTRPPIRILDPKKKRRGGGGIKGCRDLLC